MPPDILRELGRRPEEIGKAKQNLTNGEKPFMGG
jgi:hypothetical protein